MLPWLNDKINKAEAKLAANFRLFKVKKNLYDNLTITTIKTVFSGSDEAAERKRHPLISKLIHNKKVHNVSFSLPLFRNNTSHYLVFLLDLVFARYSRFESSCYVHNIKGNLLRKLVLT